jgi:hypothetical protein
MQRFLTTFVFFGFTLTAVAAPVPKKVDPPKPANYFPAAVGMRWEYQQDKNGIPVISARTVVGVEEKDGVVHLAFEFESGVQPKVSKVPVRIRVEKNEVLLTGKHDLEFKVPLHMTRRTFVPGDKWEAKFTDGTTVLE